MTIELENSRENNKKKQLSCTQQLLSPQSRNKEIKCIESEEGWNRESMGNDH